MTTSKSRFTIAQLLLLTAGVAVFCVVLMNENKWLRATYVTASLVIALNALIAAIFARGEQQAFAIGFVVGTLFFGVAANGGIFTLPFLLTLELQKWITSFTTSPPSDEHFGVVMGIFWAMLTAASSGLLGQRWHRSVAVRRLVAHESGSAGSDT
jgi:hypothetical protein